MRKANPRRLLARQLVTHTGGVNIHGADGYDPARTGSRRSIKSTTGAAVRQTPAFSHARAWQRVRILLGGYTVVEKLICDATKLYSTKQCERVFDPLSMRSQSRSVRRRRVSRAQRRMWFLISKCFGRKTDISCGRRRQPAGLWRSGRSGRLTIALQSARALRYGIFCRTTLARDALTRKTPHHDIGLGVYLLGEGASRRFSHQGRVSRLNKAEMLAGSMGIRSVRPGQTTVHGRRTEV
jgi:hypothetical protein